MSNSVLYMPLEFVVKAAAAVFPHSKMTQHGAQLPRIVFLSLLLA